MMNKKMKPNVHIWCEGKTEEEYFKSLLKYLNYDNVKINIKNLKNDNSYKKILYKIKKEPYIDKLIIIIDLDRVKKDVNELKNLEKLIKFVKESKDNRYLFLTLDNFEDWLRFHFIDIGRSNRANFYTKLGYRDTKEFKSSTRNLYYQILNKGGNIKNAEKYFCNIAVFCNKQYNIDKHSIDNGIQSNLWYFREIMDKYNNL